MKKIFYLAIATILLVNCTSKNSISSLTFKGLKGNVKSMTSACYEATERFGETQKGTLIKDADTWIPLYAGLLWEFDERGNLIKETSFDFYGDISQVIKYEYQGNNEISMRIYSGDGTLTYSWETILKDGKPINIKRNSNYSSDINDQDIACEFDGLRVKSEKHFKNGELVESIENEFKNNLLIHSITKDRDGNVTFENSSEWTNLGQPLHRHYISNGEDAIIENIIYDKQMLPIQYSRTGKFSGGEVAYSFEYTSFDKQGNWLTRIIKVEDKPISIEERTIEYY